MPRGRVLDEALQTELIPTLKQAQTPRNVDTSKHCQYHRSYGHTNESWQALKDKIEELIQADHLRKFVKTTITTSRSPQRDINQSSKDHEHLGRRDTRSCDNHHRPTRQKRSESSVRRAQPRSESPDRNNRTRRRIREVINTIATPCHSVHLMKQSTI